MESNRVQLYLSLEWWAGKTDEEGLERVLYLRLCLPLEFLSIIFFTISILWLFFTQWWSEREHEFSQSLPVRRKEKKKRIRVICTSQLTVIYVPAIYMIENEYLGVLDPLLSSYPVGLRSKEEIFPAKIGAPGRLLYELLGLAFVAVILQGEKENPYFSSSFLTDVETEVSRVDTINTAVRPILIYMEHVWTRGAAVTNVHFCELMKWQHLQGLLPLTEQMGSGHHNPAGGDTIYDIYIQHTTVHKNCCGAGKTNDRKLGVGCCCDCEVAPTAVHVCLPLIWLRAALQAGAYIWLYARWQRGWWLFFWKRGVVLQ